MCHSKRSAWPPVSLKKALPIPRCTAGEGSCMVLQYKRTDGGQYCTESRQSFYCSTKSLNSLWIALRAEIARTKHIGCVQYTVKRLTANVPSGTFTPSHSFNNKMHYLWSYLLTCRPFPVSDQCVIFFKVIATDSLWRPCNFPSSPRPAMITDSCVTKEAYHA